MNNSDFKNFEENGIKKNQDKNIQMLLNAKIKKESKLVKKELKAEEDENFWDKVGNLFGIFKCNNV